MHVHILGAGTPTPTRDRFGTSYVVEYGTDCLLFDCGPATTYRLAKMGIRPTAINYLFFTHHHFDHDADYPCFLLTRWDQGIGGEHILQVFGPPPTRKLTHQILDERDGAFAHDWLARVNHPMSQAAHTLRGGTLPRKPPEVCVHDIGPGVIRSGPNWNLSAAEALHAQPWLESLAYRLDGDEGSLVVTGDTIPCETVIDLARGADVMICMCWDRQGRMDETALSTGMSGTVEAAKMARAANVQRLVLVHMSETFARPGEMERGLHEISNIFDGTVIWGMELTTLEF